ncbi:MAG: Dienelactone hydrolase family [Chloroflexota bacterium]|jgi:carboxymethylenebutenolidase|nr:Dienelactone hydrolase family [Chloroflexota bacterium]
MAPAPTGPYGAVVLGHERYGLVQHTLDLAAKFAAYGFVALAPDMASHWDGDKEALNRGDAHLTLADHEVQDYTGRS